MQSRVDPALALTNEAWMRGKAGAEFKACFRRACGKFGDVGPRAFGIDVVWGERADTTPVVDPTIDQLPQFLNVSEIRRCLKGHLRSQHDPGRGDNCEVLSKRQILCPA